MKIKASILPLLTGIALGAVSLNTPWLMANHYRWVEGVRYSIDSYLFFFWGKYYTVTGSKMIQSATVFYSLGDFPVYAMIAIIAAILLGAISFFGGRGTVLNIKGRELKLRFNTNPVWMLSASTALLLFSYLYIKEAAKAISFALEVNNYTVEYGPSVDFLLGSVAAFAVASVMTAVSTLRTPAPQIEIKKDASQHADTAKSQKVNVEKSDILKSFSDED